MVESGFKPATNRLQSTAPGRTPRTSPGRQQFRPGPFLEIVMAEFTPKDASREAKAKADNDGYRVRARIWLAIGNAGARGMTCDEVEVATGLLHQTASARMLELRNKGFIKPSGKRPTRTGSNAVVYVATTPPAAS